MLLRYFQQFSVDKYLSSGSLVYKYQYQGQRSQDLQDWLTSKEVQYTFSLFSEEYIQESILVEIPVPEVIIIIKPDLDTHIYIYF